MFIAVWSALILKHWKRVEKTTALQWGMIGFEEDTPVRRREAILCGDRQEIHPLPHLEARSARGEDTGGRVRAGAGGVGSHRMHLHHQIRGRRQSAITSKEWSVNVSVIQLSTFIHTSLKPLFTNYRSSV